MVEVRSSKCCCGKCKREFLVDWDLEILDVSEHSMGERIEYQSDIEYECPNCDNIIYGTLYVSEYPIGALEFAKVQKVNDSENTNESTIETPIVAFFDL